MKNTATRKILSVILAVTLIFGALPMLSVQTFASNADYLEFEFQEDCYVVINCRGTAYGEVVIPSECEGLPVTGINAGAFTLATGVTSVTVPESVTTIGDYALGYEEVEVFDGSWTHTKIKGFVIKGYTYSAAHEYAIKNGITFKSIGKSDPIKYELYWTGDCYAANGCSSAYDLGNLEIPSEHNGLPVGMINSEAFAGCTKITSAKIPDSVIEIGFGAFYGCTSLKTVTISDSVAGIGAAAFLGCTNLKSVTVPSDVMVIGEYALGYGEAYYDKKIGEYVFPKIKNFVINGYTYSTAYYYALENGITFNSIGTLYTEPAEYELNDDKTGYILTSCAPFNAEGEFAVPSEYNGLPVTAIGDGAFFNCRKLTSVTIPDTVTSIGILAFANCPGLTSVTIPEGVTYIGDMAFGAINLIINSLGYGYGFNCSFVDDFKITGYKYSTAENYAIKEGLSFNAIGEVEPIRYELCGEKTEYCVAEFARSYSGRFVIPSEHKGLSVTGIDYAAFAGCNSLKSVTIPYSVTSIGEYAFVGCTKLKAVTVPNSVAYIGECALGYDEYYDSNIGDWAYSKIEGFVIYGYEGSASEEYARENGFDFVAITKLVDESTGIAVEGSLSNGTQLTAEKREATDTAVSYEITLTKDGEAVRTDGSITVKIPVPEGFDGANCNVYRKRAEDNYTGMKVVFDGTNLVFTTDSLGEYVVTTETFAPLYGDVNGDGQITPSDVVLLRRYFANYDSETGTSTLEIFPGADVNGDGDITPSDVVLLRRYFANYNSETGESTVVIGK